MNWLQSLDADLFCFVRTKLSNPFFDLVMPWLSRNELFPPLVALLAILMIWKGRIRGLVCLVVLGIVLAIGDGFICRTLKEAVARPRPQKAMTDPTAQPALRVKTDSLPSSHAANWFSAAVVLLIYYRRSWRFTIPAAVAVSFSRVYNGAHYPGDVLAGAVLGAGYAAATVWSLDALWTWAGARFFPLWWRRFPSLLNPIAQGGGEEEEPAVPPPRRPGAAPSPGSIVARHVDIDVHWIRLGWVVIAAVLCARLWYIAGDTISLSDDEAYQWVWSKHLAISFYSKPLMIALTQFLGTSIWGDTPFGVRFFSPVIAAVLSLVLLRFFAREVNARAGFFLLLIVTTTPMMAAGSVLMTVDPLSVLFWTLGMIAGWRAARPAGTTGDWLWVGLWLGLGFLSKYTALFQLLCWSMFFWLWPRARQHLRRPGPYLALGVFALCSLPVLIWNAQHDWVTVAHVAEDAGSRKPWVFTLRHLGEFLGAEFGLLNPVYFVATLWALVEVWRRFRQNPLLLFCLSMGAPVVLTYLLQSFRSRVLPNWIAPAVLPWFLMMVIYWDMRWRMGAVKVKNWLAVGLILGAVIVVVAHDTDVVKKVTGKYLPVKKDPLIRARGWDDAARVVGQVRSDLQAEGKPVFIIGAHYGIVSQITFHLPEAKAAVSDTPLAYFQSSPTPQNQYYFWPGYGHRKGENAIYVRVYNPAFRKPPPQTLVQEFESVTEIGVREISYHQQPGRLLQFFACRNLR